MDIVKVIIDKDKVIATVGWKVIEYLELLEKCKITFFRILEIWKF